MPKATRFFLFDLCAENTLKLVRQSFAAGA